MKYESKHLDHLGIVAATCREIGIVEEIDKAIPKDPRENLSTGECFLAMIINGLGFTTRSLSLTPQFFRTKPIEILIKAGITADQINDDALGRALDAAFEFGCTTLFSRISYKVIQQYGIDTKYQHLDTTVMQVHGEYENQEAINLGYGDEKQTLITYGRPKNGRQDLKQYLISLMVANDGGIPILAETIAGNRSDQTHFREALKRLKKEMKDNPKEVYHIADSQLYTVPNLPELVNSGIKFITHAPGKIGEVKNLKLSTRKSSLKDFGNGYYAAEFDSEYGGVKQRWLLVHSEQAFKKESLILKKSIKKEQERLRKDLYNLRSQIFSCEKDAIKAAKKLINKSKFQTLRTFEIKSQTSKGSKGRPKADQKLEIGYQITAGAKLSISKIKEAKKLKGRFVLATNELGFEKLSSEEILSYYKDQQQVERGFRFLKDPLCMANATFLKKPQRIVALGMLMCLCLLVYAIAQRKLRMALKEAKETVPNQINKEVQNPTMKWVFQIFEGVDVLYQKFNDQVKILVINLDDLRRKILALLGFRYQKIYLCAN